MAPNHATPIEHSEPVSDADLVSAARAGQGDDAFGELVRRYQRMVYAVALSLVQPADADDVAQDAFLRAFRNLDLLADPAKFGVWLRRITFGVAIDHVRAARSRQHGEWDEVIDVPTDEPSPLDRVERRETERRVLEALDRMPARYRVPLTLYHIDGLSHAKVASALGVPESTARSLVARARRKLSRLLAHAPEVRDMTDTSLDVLSDAPDATPRMLHVLNGDSVRMTLEHSDMRGTFAPYADVLHEGRVLRETGTAAWRDDRARVIAAGGYGTYAEILAIAEDWDAKLAAFADYDEVVLWFEHDLFDQLLLIRHLDWFGRQKLGRTTLSLICIGEYPGFEPFDGLGQLNESQLASLLGTRAPVTAEQLAFGKRAWEAFTGSDPRVLDAIVREGSSELPFFSGALERLREEYPALGTGLPRTERQMLELLSERAMAPPELFRASQRREERVFMGDWTFWARLRQLAAEPVPLVVIDGESWAGPDLRAHSVAITDAGRDVLEGRADAVALRGFDRWIGGVHLEAPLGGDVAWRNATPRIRRTPVPR